MGQPAALRWVESRGSRGRNKANIRQETMHLSGPSMHLWSFHASNTFMHRYRERDDSGRPPEEI